jgi:Cu+-exporting ATPase
MAESTETLASHTGQLAIRGMTCSACVGRVERALRKVPGVSDANVNYATEVATVHWPQASEVAPESLVQAVVDAGYEAAWQAEDAAPPVEQDSWWHTWGEVAMATALSLPLVWPMVWAVLSGGGMWMLPAWLQFALATPVQFWLGARFYKAGWAALKAGTGNMDQLVAMGTSAAWGLSCWLWWRHSGEHARHEGMAPELYFESSAVVITLVMWGKALEARAKRQASQAIRGLYALRPTSVLRLGPQGEVQVPLAQVMPGDILVVLPGGRVPADGVVTEGQGHVDESMLTGEPMPVPKGPGAVITGGTLNQEGRLLLRVKAVGQAATLAGIIRRVEQAQATKPPIQKVVDRVSAVFVPVVLVLATLTALGWLWHGAPVQQALMNAVSVLVMACPCALGLATPAALMAGTGAAARAGILIRDPQALEAAHKARVIAFDKTGTLTEGRPRVVACEVWPLPANGDTPAWDEAAALAVAASIQSGSEHPLARAVVRAWLARSSGDGDPAGQLGGAPGTPDTTVEVADLSVFKPPHVVRAVKAQVGKGVEAQVADGPWLGDWAVASSLWAAELGGLPAADLAKGLQGGPAPQGATVSWLLQRVLPGAPWRLRARLAFADAAKPHAAEALARLKARGLHTWLITGDNQAAAQALARQLGLDDVLAEVLPADKANQISRLQQLHGTVVMVGDGLNDAPALAQADVSMAMANPGAGNDLALETAGITLMRGEPMLVEAALDISARTTRKIHQNLAWAFIYNVVGLPLAAFGLFNPMLAGAAMALSSISVLLNAITLLRWRPAQAHDVNSNAAVRSSTG